MEGDSKQPCKYKKRKVSAVRDFPFGCGPFAPLFDHLKPPPPLIPNGHPLPSELPKPPSLPPTDSDRPPSEKEQVALPPTPPKRLPRPRKVSAVRDFPFGCGHDAPVLTEKERLQFRLSSNGTVTVVVREAEGVRENAREATTPAVEEEKRESRIVKEAEESDRVVDTPVALSEGGDSFKEKIRPRILKREVRDDEGRSTSKSQKSELSKEKNENFNARAIASDHVTGMPVVLSKGGDSFREKVKEKMRQRMLMGEVSHDEGSTSKRKAMPDSSPSTIKGQKSELSEEKEENFHDRAIVFALMAAPNVKRRCKPKSGCGRSRPLSIRQTKREEAISDDEGMEIVVRENNEDDSTRDGGGEDSARNENLSLVPFGSLESSKNSKVCEAEDDDGEGSVPLLGELHGTRSLSLIPFGLPESSNRDNTKGEVVTRNKVRETLRLFQAICRKLLQEEESKVKEREHPNIFRIDLVASKLLREKQMWVNTGKPILGVIPGVEVGDEFQYRVELAIVGIHRPFQGGIDYLKKGKEILATSIVASGGYDDETDSSDVLIYLGSGGTVGGKGEKRVEDQKLERGNLALKNSIHARSPVRVIRGFKELKTSESHETRPKVVTTYTYDGLYMVEKYWQEQGNHGCSVFKFQLRRIPGQPELAFKQVKKSKKSRVQEGLVMDDISMGEEMLPICVVNTVDGELPPPFKYVTKAIHHPWYNLSSPRGCDCTNGCSDSNNCSCAVKNGGEIPFNFNGAIVEAKPLVYECGPSCKCPPSCHNRVSQHGMKFPLEVFKTQSRGWGVRSLASIPSGSFICEYTGELLEEIEAEQRTGNDEYLFDIGHNYSDQSLWDGLSTLIPDLQTSGPCDVVDGVGFTIDAAKYGNVGRFINHSCSPNLYAQNVLYDHDDKRMPHIMFFAAENIPPLQELTYHYNYCIDQVRDSDGNIKRKDCYCGSQECTGRLY
ncbi:Histone-lysine N-methyltransferase, H3 lysine-9 specific SUVH6 [Acorus gramineus]|uniref:Histone-lysine N-methyltransferase, H3 lysine-9 specific SUVH6 n=1 Tax=Acorus gramineus TaxID=55184 RepID=A0AAV9BBD7_ACOGR|nr:Histone-lysine N-methyltransferase, H3 lysine-9 specific SUVH6 [Acorus gramineus]